MPSNFEKIWTVFKFNDMVNFCAGMMAAMPVSTSPSLLTKKLGMWMVEVNGLHRFICKCKPIMVYLDDSTVQKCWREEAKMVVWLSLQSQALHKRGKCSSLEWVGRETPAFHWLNPQSVWDFRTSFGNSNSHIWFSDSDSAIYRLLQQSSDLFRNPPSDSIFYYSIIHKVTKDVYKLCMGGQRYFIN